MTIQQHASFDSSSAELNATSKLVRAWESKNAKNAAKAGGISLMALSLAACGGSSTTTTATDSTATDTATDTTTTTTVVAGQTVILKTIDETATGGEGADTFDGYTTGNTLNSGDTINGAGGADTLIAHGLVGGTIKPVSMTSVETVVVRSQAGTTDAVVVDLTNATGVETVVVDQIETADTVTFTKVAASTELEVRSTVGESVFTLADATAVDNTATTAVEGNTATLNVKGDSGVVTLEGVEIVNIVASTHNGSTGASIDELTNASVNSIVVTGGIATDIGLIDDASSSLTVSIDGSATAGLSADTRNLDGTVTITGSSSKDVITTDVASLDALQTWALGAGADVLKMADELKDGSITNAAGLKAAIANISGVTTLHLMDGTDLGTASGGGDELTMDSTTGMAGITRVILEDGAADFNLVAADTTFEVVKSSTVDLLEIDSFRTAGIVDTTLVLNGTSVITDLDSAGNGTLSIASGGTGTNTITNLTGTADTKIVATGATALDVGTLGTSTLTIDGSALTGALTATASANASSVKGGAGNDTLTGGAGADQIVGNAGNDTIAGAAAADTIDAGAGNDTITVITHATDLDTVTTGTGNDIVQNTTATAATAAVMVITDFDFGTSTTAVDVLKLSDTGLTTLTTTTDVVDSSANSVAATNGTVHHLASDGEVVANADVIVLSGTYATAAAALTGMGAAGGDTITFSSALTANDSILVAYTDGTNSFLGVATADTANLTSSASFDTFVNFVQFSDTDLTNFDSSDFAFIA